ncbi:MAG: hypothetical protein IKI68_00360, partial [Clostridia bacterium]|nr:hypothetical protein [Clostridia bacterium]
IAGLKMFEDRIEIDPEMIPWWKELSFSVCWHGCRIKIRLDNEKIEITAHSDNLKEIPIVMCGEKYCLQSGETAIKTISVNNEELCGFHNNTLSTKERKS